MAESVVVVEGFIGRIGDVERVFRPGELIRGDDPAVKKWPQFFGPVQYAEVEQATAAPGERRRFRRPAAKAEKPAEGKAVSLASLEGKE